MSEKTFRLIFLRKLSLKHNFSCVKEGEEDGGNLTYLEPPLLTATRGQKCCLGLAFAFPYLLNGL